MRLLALKRKEYWAIPFEMSYVGAGGTPVRRVGRAGKRGFHFSGRNG